MSIDSLRQKYIRYITWIELYIKSASSLLNDQSLNVHIEYTVIRLINLTYGYSLRNVNSRIGNIKAIDASDESNNLCFQITSNTKFNKIYDTVNKYIIDNLYSKYNNLNFFYLGKKRELSDHQLDKIEQLVNGKCNFDNKNIFDFYDILAIISEDFDLLKSSIDLLEKEIPFLVKFINSQIKSKIGISLSYVPSDFEYKLIKEIVNLFLDSNFCLYTYDRNLITKSDSHSLILIDSSQQLPQLDICLLFLKNETDNVLLKQCIILNKCIDGQTLIQNISFEHLHNVQSDVINLNCYKLIKETNLYPKINKLILAFIENLKTNDFQNREGIEELKEIYSNCDYKYLNKDEESENYYTYHMFSDYDDHKKFLVLRKKIPSFEKARDEFRKSFPDDKNFVLLVHKDSRHKTDRRLSVAQSLFNVKHIEYVSTKIGKAVKKRFIQNQQLKSKIFIEPVLTDRNLPEKGNAGLGDILDWFNQENKPILFLIGQGGIGKTTLCQFIHDQLIKENQIVLYINSYDLVNDLADSSFSIGNEAYDIYNFYTKWFPRTETHSTMLTRNSFYSNLSNGNIKIIFDGIDEIISSKPNFNLAAFIEFIESLVEISHLSKIIISIRDYQFKLLNGENRYLDNNLSSHEIFEVELFSEEMAKQYFMEKFKNTPKVNEECINVIKYMLGDEKQEFKYPPYLLFLISKIVTNDSKQMRDSAIDNIIDSKIVLDKILIEYLQREFGKKSFINLGIEISDQLQMLLNLAFYTTEHFNADQADRIIKRIKKEYHSEEFFRKLTDHPYFRYDESSKYYDFQFDFLRDHLRSIKLSELLKNERPKTEFEIEFIGEYLKPQTVLFKLVLDRIKQRGQHFIISYIKSLIIKRNECNNSEENFDLEDSISNLFQLLLECEGKRKSSIEYTKVLLKVFESEKKSGVVDCVILKDCPHGHGITFNFNDLIITNAVFSNYSRFYECDFNENTFIWDNCILNQIPEPEINKELVTAKMMNFSEKISGDKSYLDILLKKDKSYSELNNITITSIKKSLTALINTRKDLTKSSIQKFYLVDNKFNAEIFSLTIDILENNNILIKEGRSYHIRTFEMENVSFFIENTYISGSIAKVIKSLKEKLIELELI